MTVLKKEIISPHLVAGDSAEEFQFKVFAVLWATATLFHMAHSSVFDTQLNLALLTVAAFFVIVRPSLASFLILITLQMFDAFFRMPFTTNHWIFTAFVNVTILQAALILAVKTRTFNIKGGELFKLFRPVIKIEVVILYFFAVFHKLNSGFFTPATSCATELLKAQHLDQIIPLNDSFLALNPYLTLIIESSIPLTLCFRRTTNAGVLIGLFFHCVLSYSTYNAFYDFSSLMFAAYFLFLDRGFSTTLYHDITRIQSILNNSLDHFSYRRLLYISVFLILSLGFVYILNKRLDTFHDVHLYFFWTIYSVLFAALLIRYMLLRNKIPRSFEPTFPYFQPALIIMPVIIFVNGTLPYLGLKTENSFAMFSNLRTEGGKTNHFILSSDIQIFDYQKDVVEIISSTNPWLQQLADEKKALILFEFRNYVHERKPEHIEYLLNGKKRTFLKSESDSFQALGENPYLLRKLMKFRPFSLQEPQQCAH